MVKELQAVGRKEVNLKSIAEFGSNERGKDYLNKNSWKEENRKLNL